MKNEKLIRDNFEHRKNTTFKSARKTRHRFEQWKSTSFEYDGNKKHNNSNNGPSTSFEYKENKEHYKNSNNGPSTSFEYTKIKNILETTARSFIQNLTLALFTNFITNILTLECLD